MTESGYQLFDLTGRVAVITGGAGLLGQKHADIITRFGGIAVLADIRAAEAEKAASVFNAMPGRKASAVEADVSDKRSVEAMVREVMSRYGQIDILINNAAMTVSHGGKSSAQYFAPFEDYSLGLWDAAIKINLTGLFLVTQAVGREMMRQRRGVVVNMASDLSLISPDHRIYDGEAFNTPISYAVSKSAVLGFTRYLATYWAKHNIRVNALSPAGVFQGHSPAFVTKLSSLIPLGRMAAEDEYQGAILFLVSDASSFMTGSNLVVDGGRTCW